MQDVCNNINEVKTFLQTETKRGHDGAEDGSLAGDATAAQILREIKALTTREIVGYSNESYYLANLGVQTERDGSFTLDTSKFEAALATNPDLLNVVFASKYSTDNDNLKVTGSENYPPVAGSYSFSFTHGSSNGTLNGETVTPPLKQYWQQVFTGKSGNAKNISVELLSDITTSQQPFGMGRVWLINYKNTYRTSLPLLARSICARQQLIKTCLIILMSRLILTPRLKP